MSANFVQSKNNIEHYNDDFNDKVIGLWLHGKSENTQAAYTRDVKQFRSYIKNPYRPFH